MSVTQPSTRRFTCDEYHVMGDAGIFDGQRVELIEGEVVEMAPQKAAHAAAVGLVDQALRTAFGPKYWIRTQLPLRLSAHSEPEPDLSVVPGSPRDYRQHPGTALLVVEVSDASLGFDRGPKLQLYVDAQIPEYWIVNLIDRQLEVYRDPARAANGACRYASVRIYAASESVTPLSAPATVIAVSELLP